VWPHFFPLPTNRPEPCQCVPRPVAIVDIISRFRSESAKFRLDSYLSLVYSMPIAKRPMTDNAARDLFPGALEMMILESLRRQPAHGYALVQHIQQRSNNLLQVEEGSLYPALQRLLKAKLVKAEWGVSVTNRRVRTYRITASGLKRLEQQISSFERMFEGIALVLNPGKATTS
jgi:PadR family transcriptional regulator, regulatory protein PadR